MEQQTSRLSLRATVRTLDWISRHSDLALLPPEIIEHIYSMNNPMTPERSARPSAVQNAPEPSGPRGDPSIPPPDGKCPLSNVPAELRRIIFASFLPDKNVIIKPKCDHGSRSRSTERDTPKRNKTSDLMVLCRKFKNEIACNIYQERTFEIHVHEGLTDGGIEFLSEGRQPLQYRSEDCGIESRFTRFNDGEEFGFDRLKKINIIIYPKADAQKERHTAINTYFMNLALAQMLDGGFKKNDDRITSLSITFDTTSTGSAQHLSGRAAIMRGESPWWDPSQEDALSSEIHGMSDIELILRPFSILRQVHNVEVKLPPKFKAHTKTTDFVTALKKTMTGPSSGDPPFHDGSFEFKANAIKADLFNSHNFGEKYGRKGDLVLDLTEQDMQDHADGEHDRAFKHVLSPFDDGGDFKRQKGPEIFSDDDDGNDSGADVSAWRSFKYNVKQTFSIRSGEWTTSSRKSQSESAAAGPRTRLTSSPTGNASASDVQPTSAGLPSIAVPVSRPEHRRADVGQEREPLLPASPADQPTDTTSNMRAHQKARPRFSLLGSLDAQIGGGNTAGSLGSNDTEAYESAPRPPHITCPRCQSLFADSSAFFSHMSNCKA